MIKRICWSFLLAGLLLLPLAATAQDEEAEDVVTRHENPPDTAAFEIVTFAEGFSTPLLATHAGDGSGRVFVVEQSGRIWIVDADGQRLDAPFIDLSHEVSQDVTVRYSERGLLGLAFHPQYAENGLFYVNYTDQVAGTTRIVEYSVSADDPDSADLASARDILAISQPYTNHNGGYMAFGHDGYLYISVGDGGAGNDPLAVGQDPADLLGTIIRIDVDNQDDDSAYAVPPDNPYIENDALAPEVWAWGLRNVWRFSFDTATGDLYLADVGQSAREEVNFQPADSAGGENYGWPAYEGSLRHIGPEPMTDVVLPVIEYDHSVGCSITGGYVYRGEAIPALDGYYLFSDWCSGRLWAGYRTSEDVWRFDQIANLPVQVSSFGQDEAGEVYIIGYNTGEILRFAPAD
ncbi:MAG: glucose dehydrogenase [Anaerolineaceae bacterium]|nr:MAG: glucose dehydrogenase [Anaerolineaceae bacterium]